MTLLKRFVRLFIVTVMRATVDTVARVIKTRKGK